MGISLSNADNSRSCHGKFGVHCCKMKAPSSKTEVDAIVSARATESQTLEFKSTLPANSDRDCFEFAADVSALANTAGGAILFGIRESHGVAIEAAGLAGFNSDADVRRLEQILANGVEPRIPGVQLVPIPGFQHGPILLVVVPRSWIGPHMVSRSGQQRFFQRGAASKVPMSIDQIRSAFVSTEETPRLMRAWRDERVNTVGGGHGTTRLRTANGSFFLHLLPFAAFARATRVDVVGLRDRLPIRPLAHGGWGVRITHDGVMWHATTNGETRECLAYTLLFRSGAIEAWLGDLVKGEEGNRRVPSVAMEKYPIQVLGDYFEALRLLDVPLPWAVGLSMFGVRGARLAVSQRFFGPDDIDWFDRSQIHTDLLVFESSPADIGAALRPAFDQIWNAAGWPGSLNYDEAGRWVGQL